MGPLEEIGKAFNTEFDYILEAENLDLVRKNIMSIPRFAEKVRIPKP